MKSDVVIIGGGLAGLSTGALLAKQGKRVTVIEKGNQPGGRAYAYEEKGFTFNYGPHAMYLPESGELAKVMAPPRPPRARSASTSTTTSPTGPTATASPASARRRTRCSPRSSSR